MKRILIVDDDKSMLALLNVKLKKKYEVTLAESGSEGLELLKKQKFDLISLDQIMPEMNGLDTFRRMKAEVKELPPVIMVTGDKTLSVIIEFMRLGGSDYVVKSGDLTNDLKLRIEHVWQERQKENELRELRTVRKVAVTLMHEFNNALSMISGANAILKKDYGENKYNKNISDNVARIHDAIKKMREMTEVDTALYSEISEVFNLSGKGFEKEKV